MLINNNNNYNSITTNYSEITKTNIGYYTYKVFELVSYYYNKITDNPETKSVDTIYVDNVYGASALKTIKIIPNDPDDMV